MEDVPVVLLATAAALVLGNENFRPFAIAQILLDMHLSEHRFNRKGGNIPALKKLP
jgi:hypothetical protein